MKNFQIKNTPKKICWLTKKKSTKGGNIIHRGISKKKGGIGLQLVKNNKRQFFPNLQKVRIKLKNGMIKKVWLSAKALKSWKVEKVV